MVGPDMQHDPAAQDAFPTVSVVNENALVCQRPGWAACQILAGLIRQGGPDPMQGTMHLSPLDKVRPATVADFETFRVSGPEHYGITA